mmetsp:Transcript_960/g.3303  ORF Transcript_960/g.3303 Transcript_960/m.3303 type:complete len:333 (-) Transcript_960:2462-3460(-)|eukprot:CAMPEP_0117447786 /NCGR_PEP_ID=MMETSP0759-20121206/7058_1 /TAXON_ID=63605 /ORGANISM="Percolomonas cosmopolitus, Strain WS" /LENGTH=332 /DNA_ID=CAMNT_0005240139 /DNA_START=231 /DNA_END=1229 /DNA_ORIENTATION=+
MSIRTKVFFPKSQSSHSIEIRRWKVESFQQLQERIQRILNTESLLENYRLQYLDDINDWVVLEQPDEFDEAVALSQSSDGKVLVIRIIPLMKKATRAAARHGCASQCCPRKQLFRFASSEGALPFIIQLAAPTVTKKSVPIQGESTGAETVEVHKYKRVPVEVERKEPEEIPITKVPARKVRSIPIVDVDEGSVSVKQTTSVPVESNEETSVEIPVTKSPAREIRRIPIEEVEGDAHEEAPVVEKEEANSVEVSGIIENEYTIEDDEDNTSSAPSPSAPEQEQPSPKKTKWQDEEEVLQCMGFGDGKLNFHLLNHHKGNMERTIHSLLQLEQ